MFNGAGGPASGAQTAGQTLPGCPKTSMEVISGVVVFVSLSTARGSTTLPFKSVLCSCLRHFIQQERLQCAIALAAPMKQPWSSIVTLLCAISCQRDCDPLASQGNKKHLTFCAARFWSLPTQRSTAYIVTKAHARTCAQRYACSTHANCMLKCC